MEISLNKLSETLGASLKASGWCIATAESCTGGGVAAAITSVPGSSAWFEYGIVSYANLAKQKLLGVSPATLADHGAVSEAVVREMVLGVLALSGANIALAVSGIAGPDGGSPEKPVGSVWFAWATATGELKTELRRIPGSRAEVQAGAVSHSINGALVMVKKNTV